MCLQFIKIQNKFTETPKAYSISVCKNWNHWLHDEKCTGLAFSRLHSKTFSLFTNPSKCPTNSGMVWFWFCNFKLSSFMRRLTSIKKSIVHRNLEFSSFSWISKEIGLLIYVLRNSATSFLKVKNRFKQFPLLSQRTSVKSVESPYSDTSSVRKEIY